MRFLRAFTILFIAIGCVGGVSGQSYYTALEVGIAGGATQYFGDLNDHYGFKTISAAGGIYARERLTSYIAVKISANYTTVGYDDKYNSDPFEKTRNLNFKSTIMEGLVQAEFNFFGYVTGDKTRRFTPYLTGGIGAFYYNPYTTYNGNTYYLQPLGTEGQHSGYGNRKYGNVSPCFPIGAGVKLWVRKGVNIAFEVVDRLTTTDYLDDVSTTYVGAGAFQNGSVAQALQNRSTAPNTTLGESGKQRGNTSSYDQYLMAQLSLTFNFTSYKCPAFMSFDDQLRVHR